MKIVWLAQTENIRARLLQTECGSFQSVVGTAHLSHTSGLCLPRKSQTRFRFGAILEIPKHIAGAAADADASSPDAGFDIFDLIMEKEVKMLPQLFAAMVRFLELAESEVPRECQPAKTRGVQLNKDTDHYLQRPATSTNLR